MSNLVMVLSMRLAYVQMALESVHVPFLLPRSNLPSLRSMALALIRCCHRPCSAFLDSALFTEIDMHRLDGLAFARIDVATPFPVDVHVLLPPLDQVPPRTDLWLWYQLGREACYVSHGWTTQLRPYLRSVYVLISWALLSSSYHFLSAS
jgi:hypothetical protein